MTTTRTTGKPFKVHFVLNDRPQQTSHASLRNAEVKVGRVVAAGATNVEIRYYDPSRGTVIVEALGGSLGWTSVERVHNPFAGAWS